MSPCDAQSHTQYVADETMKDQSTAMPAAGEPFTRCSMATLEYRFLALWQRSGLLERAASPETAWRALCAGYGAIDRHYHGADHLAFCLAEFDLARALADEPDAVEMAIWFHDSILVPEASDNEPRSSVLFEQLANGHFDAAFVAGVSSLILATTHRRHDTRPDEQLVCDIDLASLGCDWPRFLADCQALRAESLATAEAYSAAKLRFLGALLARPRIFNTDHFHARYEASARDNIGRLSAMLRAGEFP